MAEKKPIPRPAATVNIPKKATAGPIERYVRGQSNNTPQMSGTNFGSRGCCGG